MKRRDFLFSTAAMMAASAFGNPTWVHADGARANVLILYFRGGLDMLWAAPLRSGDAFTRLNTLRPNIKVAPGDILVPAGTENAPQQVGLHKAWQRLHETASGNIRLITKVGNLAFDPNNPNKSHADCQKISLSGQLNIAVALGLVGKAHNRYNLGLLNTVGLGGNGSEELASNRGDIINLYSFGSYEKLNRNFGTHVCDDYKRSLDIWADNNHLKRAETALQALDTEGAFVDAFQAAKGALNNSLSEVNTIIRPTVLTGEYRRFRDDGVFVDNGVATLFKDVAKFFKSSISRNTRIAQLSVGGWDSHSGQASLLNSRIQEVAGGMRGLIDDMKASGIWNKTIILCMTEFGRTVQENGGQGTDHGYGNTSMAISGMFGSKIIGDSFRPADFDPLYHYLPTISYLSPINEVFTKIGLPLDTLIEAPLTAPRIGLFT